jgi:preprotein translocase subunit SecA
MNKQREEIYRFRRELLEGSDQRDYVFDMAENIIFDFLEEFASKDVDHDQWDFENLKVNIKRIFGIEIPDTVTLPVQSSDNGDTEQVPLTKLSRPELEEYLISEANKRYEEKEEEASVEFMRWFERMVILQILDQQWKDHLLALDHLKEGIGLRGYGQKDPKVEYKRESFSLFEDLSVRLREEVVRMLFLLRPASEQPSSEVLGARARQAQRDISYSSGGSASAMDETRTQQARTRTGPAAGVARPVTRNLPKVGRNDPCPCGSGKKFKKCCGS